MNNKDFERIKFSRDEFLKMPDYKKHEVTGGLMVLPLIIEDDSWTHIDRVAYQRVELYAGKTSQGVWVCNDAPVFFELRDNGKYYNIDEDETMLDDNFNVIEIVS